jgi:glycosyltransferase involved in cell wall biosynthesis
MPAKPTDSVPFLSVCIPTYNRAGMLLKAIESVLAQDFDDFELIVCDNASTDGTEAVVKGYTEPRLRYERFPELVGMYANHNRCVRLARAPWIVFLHSDDVLAPSALAALHRAATTAPPNTGLLLPKHDREVLRNLSGREWYGQIIRAPQTLVLAITGIGSPSVTGFFAEALKQIGGFSEDADISYTADHDAYARIASAGWSFLLIDEPVECTGFGPHQATNRFVRTGDAVRSFAAYVHRMAQRPGWKDAMAFLSHDLSHWPSAQVANLLFLLSIAGLKQDYRSLLRVSRSPEVDKMLLTKRARLADIIGPTAYFQAVRWHKIMRRAFPG